MGSSLVIAALAGCGNVVITNPIWVLVIRMQTQRSRAAKRDPSESCTAWQIARSVLLRGDGTHATLLVHPVPLFCSPARVVHFHGRESGG